jgi:hypothetical protein
VTPCSSIAAGIAAAQWGGTVSNCYVTDNVTIETTRKHSSTKLYSNRIANNWEEQDRSGTVSNCCTSNSEYTNSVCNAKNNAAIVYTNWGTAPSGYPNEPYLWNANGITPNVNTDFVLLGVDNSQAQAGSIRNNAIVLHNANKKDFSYNGTTYALYPAGSDVVVEFYLEGHVGDWSSQDYGYYVEQNSKYYWCSNHFPDIPQIEKSICPVCGKYEFEPLTWDDIYCGVTPSDVYCMSCGWHYSPEQEKSPELTNGANAMSLKEYRIWYDKKVLENPNYDYFEESTNNYVPSPHKCPVCGKYEFEDDSCYDICPFCGWEDDGVQLSDPNFDGGANELSLNQYKFHYKQKIKENPDYKWEKSHS